MRPDEIIKMIESESYEDRCFRFYMDSDSVLTGRLVKGPDHEQLTRSNVWRFVPVEDIPEWHKANSLKLTELIHGKNIVQIIPLS